MTGRGRIVAPLTLVILLSLVACAPALPETVVPGSAITAGWSGEFTSANAAASPTSGNLDIAATTRAGFGDLVGGEFVPDESFGSVAIVDEDPFTVRYDLAEPRWSDGIPLDAADLLLGWAAASGYLDPSDEAVSVDAATLAEPVPSVDEFERSIQVTYSQPVSDWQQRITVAVPAHVVAERALGMDDPMEAKQAVITAIQQDDADALASIAEVWQAGFALPETGAIPEDLLVSSGPFRVDQVSTDAEGQSVTLVPNAAYRGLVTPKVARIALVPSGDDPVSALGERLDVAMVTPLASNRESIDALERKDFVVNTTHDGTVWAMLLNPAGVFTQQPARAAFIRAIPAGAMVERGGGVWASAYAATSSMLSAPGSRAYDIVNEDSGFAAALGGADDPAQERQSAGIASGAQVCVLYDRASEFATGAFAALRDAAVEAGWSAVDCGTDDLAAAVQQGGWDAVISRVPIPQTAAQIAAQWGGQGQEALVGGADAERDALIAQLSAVTDVYAARDLRAQIEASLVRAAVALPIAVNPTLTLIDKDVTGIAPRDGAQAPLTSGVVQWAIAP